MQKFDFDKLEKNSCGNHNFLWLFAVVAVFLTDVTILAGSHLCMRIQKIAFTDRIITVKNSDFNWIFFYGDPQLDVGSAKRVINCEFQLV